MIKIERGEIPENPGLAERRKKELQRIRELASCGKLKSDNFKNGKLWREFKELLYELQHGKCCYCERGLLMGEAHVEHFRPKAKVEEAERHPGYWWLAYSWENLLLACETCNIKKGAKFPLEPGSERLDPEDCDLEKEKPILINPLKEDPEEFIEYDFFEEDIEECTEDDLSEKLMVKAVGKCERGQKTVSKLTGINNRYMMQERASKLENFEEYELWAGLKDNKDRASKRLSKYISRRSEFSGFARFYFRKKGLI